MRTVLYSALLPFLLINARADKLDSFVETLIERRGIAGLSLAVIQEGQIVKAAAYGLADKQSKTPVTTNTLFQAGSISKPVAALTALHLVETKKLSLDEDVNEKLRSWKVPENGLTKTEKVTLRRILSHNAGLTVHGFPGYAIDKPAPSLIEILNGVPPANTKPICVDITPGTTVRYSGGGFTVMQQLIIDVSEEPFAPFSRRTILAPLGMGSSTFEQPLPEPARERTAHGYYRDGSPVEGRWHIYPEMAAAGLWTTPCDLARFAIGLQRLLAGNGPRIVSQAIAREMLTVQKENVGLGVALERTGHDLRFKHAGRDEGFDALMIGYAEAGHGAVLMINSNDNTRALERIVEWIAREYKWPSYP